ncbi:MAG: hypothetical protein P0Y53_03500 [Candidatus Pseudobacter hemicellulosilyticus]|uniref:Uncharacterized protein n=1 Tax=Candidatus Pseudobacter hemicellulosilyticus TaxID=3121375 RepID=A0AAJ5WYD5_9BACT|nr:MAG: hypothetical protein P0Y53_03500 [Pseudobacter sp.]
MTHPAITQQTFSKAVSAATHPVHEAVMADSLEVMVTYHREKVQVLERTLQQLNLLDNAREIAFICRELTQIKATLRQLEGKRPFNA